MLRLSLVVALLAAQAHAQPAFAVRAPTSCPDGDSVRARIEQRLGHSLDDVVLGISIEITAEPGRFVARIGDDRTLVADTCEELVDAIAVIAARLAREHPHVAEKRTSAVVMPSAAPELHVEAAAPEPPARWTIGARASLIAGIGVVPHVGAGSELVIVGGKGIAFAELGAAHWLDRAATIPLDGPAHVDVGVDSGLLRAGVRYRGVRAWLVGEAGVIRGSGMNLAGAQAGSAGWFAAGAGVALEYRLSSRLRAVGTSEVLGVLERARFQLADGELVYQPPPSAARVTCGLELEFL